MSAVTASGSVAAPRRKRRLGPWIGLGAGVLVLVVAAVAVVFAPGILTRHRSYRVSGGNMEPGLRPGDRVVTTVVGGGRYAPKRGDIVLFTAPPAWGAEDGTHLSRVIAVPDETISCAGPGHPPVVNGRSLKEPYTRGGGGEAPYNVVVPPGRLWVMGDNRLYSYDSREYYLRTRDVAKATVPTNLVVAVVDQQLGVYPRGIG